jgi:hypothetical protein
VLRVERSGTRSLKTSGLVSLFGQEGRRRGGHGPAAELVVASTFWARPRNLWVVSDSGGGVESR